MTEEPKEMDGVWLNGTGITVAFRKITKRSALGGKKISLYVFTVDTRAIGGKVFDTEEVTVGDSVEILLPPILLNMADGINALDHLGRHESYA